ncbi:MAG: NAD-binding protein [Sedimentisphaerales bacterium]|nr:NAD-binding protein [Sedimentisphaerales bacterium]
MHTVIVGGGKLVYFLSRTFLAKGYQVTLVNRSEAECRWLARQSKATVVFGDGSDPRILQEAGAATAEAVLAATPNDEDNLVICQLASLRFGVPRTLALVNDPDNEATFQKLGVTTAFSTTHLVSSLIEQRAGFEEITAMTSVAEGKVNVTEVLVRPTSPVAGRALVDVQLPANSLIACILRDSEAIVPRGSTILNPMDRLIVITLPENHGQVLRALTGDDT